MELQDTINAYNLSAAVAAAADDDVAMPCFATRTAPSVNICTYEARRDKFVSAMLLSDGVWEPDVTAAFQEALRFYPDAVVVDLGANVGYYSLLGAAMRHDVIAVEPVRENVRRLHKGALLSGVAGSIRVLLNAVSSRHEHVTFTYRENNVGGTSVRAISVADAERLTQHARDAVATTLTTDDLLDVMNVTLAVMKIDIEGYECRALLSAQRFLDRVFVPYIFIEWRVMFRHQHFADSPCLTSDIRRLSAILDSRKYVPYVTKDGRMLEAVHSATRWQDGDVYWRHWEAPRLHDT
ncbi:PREDICTED: uncharacterized protein LOC106818773 [Priapulus caudatus]|uniref:Uncharacterized protein LOC106818773 n=1 Tax=Priapulus caudatus TaxID=37621 RepID=A0ABM1F3B4_PRICU|nr:PREDICTED: uncharacterized protein LOC106818773 [Priapulus caudatus]